MACSALLMLSSCDYTRGDEPNDDGEWIYDLTPITFEVEILNQDGENLLEESTPGNILGSEMFLIYNGERYEIINGYIDTPYFPYPNGTRFYMPSWYGGFIAPYWYPSKDLPERENSLHIGEFEGGTDGVSFDLSLNGHSYIVSYTNKVSFHKGQIDAERHYYLDGVEVCSDTPYCTFTIVM